MTGGASGKDGFILLTDEYMFESKLTKDGIEVSHQSRTEKPKKPSKVEAWILKSPFGRYLDPVLGWLSWKFILGLVLFQLFFYNFSQPGILRLKFHSHTEAILTTLMLTVLHLFMLATFLLILYFLVKWLLYFVHISRFHSVEHMCLYAVENGVKADIGHFRSCPRLTLYCGSAMSFLLAPLIFPIFHWIPTSCLLVSLWVSYIFIGILRQILIIHGPQKVVSVILFLQKAVCWKPTEEQLRLGLETVKYIRKIYPSQTEA